MNKMTKLAAVSAVVAATGLTAVGASADWDKDRGNCKRGESSSMMKRGERGERQGNRDLDLSAAEAKTLVEARLIMRGNDRVKAGQVTEKDQDTYLVDIVTVDDSLVRQVEVSRAKGLPRGAKGRKR